jgi:hypothetical protein
LVKTCLATLIKFKVKIFHLTFFVYFGRKYSWCHDFEVKNSNSAWLNLSVNHVLIQNKYFQVNFMSFWKKNIFGAKILKLKNNNSV